MYLCQNKLYIDIELDYLLAILHSIFPKFYTNIFGILDFAYLSSIKNLPNPPTYFPFFDGKHILNKSLISNMVSQFSALYSWKHCMEERIMCNLVYDFYEYPNPFLLHLLNGDHVANVGNENYRVLNSVVLCKIFFFFGYLH